VDFGLRDTRALVTAGSKGIGRACAAALAAEGSRVIIASRDARTGERAAGEIGAARHIVADLSSAEDRVRLIAEAEGHLGGLDILVVNFPQPPLGTLDALKPDAWQVGYDAVLKCHVDLVRLALPALKRSGRGRIVNITGIAVREPSPGFVVSAAYRSAVTAVSKALSIEVAKDGVTVNNVAPGSVETEQLRVRLDRSGRAAEDAFLATVPARRLGRPEEIGAVCAFICSTSAAYLTGQTLVVDGGASRGAS